jgi:tetratricopeptide (TPR) repeat protein
MIQKISESHFTACNEVIIQNCQTALQAKSSDEWEYYALEHFSLHLLIQAMESKDAASLKALAYDTAHWNRQVEISKGFEWGKRMLNDMMLWASKHDDDEVIQCMLNKVDLNHQEQNDAPRIVELVAQNDLETALQRIEAFGGNDKEGIQRKFTLYMLCLMDLTLLDSKDKPFRKEAIEKLLKHLDENLPVDHSVLNWDDFFPSYLMFQMACEWAELELGYLNIYTRTNDWEKEWISEGGPYSDLQFEVLTQCSFGIKVDIQKNYAKIDIAKVWAKQGRIQEALECSKNTSDDLDNSIALKDISTELVKIGKVDEALEIAHKINYTLQKSIALKEISSELANQGKMEEAITLMQEALECAQGNSISSDRVKNRALKDISTELAKQGKLEEAASAMQEALSCARSISEDWSKIHSQQINHKRNSKNS